MIISCQFLVTCQNLCNQIYKYIKNSIKNILIYIIYTDIDSVILNHKFCTSIIII